MREFVELLADRGREINKHLSLIRELQDAAEGRARGGPVDTEHVNILKSGFLIHLYNVVESVMTKTLEDIAATTQAHQPHSWVDGLFRAWLSHRSAMNDDIASQDRLERIVEVIAEASGRSALTSTRVARPERNWSDQEIVEIAKKLACTLAVQPDVQRAACVVYFQNNMSPMRYVRHMRNQLAHGNMSFVNSATHLSVTQLDHLRMVVLDYMKDVSESFARYLEEQEFLRTTAA